MVTTSHLIPLIKETPEYQAIYQFYDNGNEKATRSQVPKINHIDEGLVILAELGSDEIAMKAWCIHPLFQMDEDFDHAIDTSHDWTFDWKAVAITVEYRRCANAYLCRESTDDYTLGDLPDISNSDVHNMLIADKIQNKKDFMVYHYGTHDRSIQLHVYFNNWLSYLYVSAIQYDTMCNLIDAHKQSETDYLLSSQSNRQSLEQSIEQLQ